MGVPVRGCAPAGRARDRLTDQSGRRLLTVRVLATRRYPGPAFDELDDVEVGSLAALDAPRPDVEGLAVSNEAVPLELLPNLRIVANFGVGYDRIDVAACSERGVVVTNTPGVLDEATADLAFALILATRRRVVEGDRLVRAGGWTGSWAGGSLAEEVTGSTLGLVGFGRIGSAVARRARGFELRVLYSARRRVDTDLAERRELDALLAESDIVSIHVPLTPETEGLIDARRLALLRDGACFVNTARGEIVDEQALVAELVSGRIRAGLDVFTREPHVPEELFALPNVVLTPHIGSAHHADARGDDEDSRRQPARTGARQSAADPGSRVARSARCTTGREDRAGAEATFVQSIEPATLGRVGPRLRTPRGGRRRAAESSSRVLARLERDGAELREHLMRLRIGDRGDVAHGVNLRMLLRSAALRPRRCGSGLSSRPRERMRSFPCRPAPQTSGVSGEDGSGLERDPFGRDRLDDLTRRDLDAALLERLDRVGAESFP